MPARMSGIEMIMAVAKDERCGRGHGGPQHTGHCAGGEVGPAWAVTSSPNADPRRAAGARVATAADWAVSPHPMPSPARMNPAASR